ncbi:cyclin-D1-1 isoform X1 [Hevea brasiliensis]|uniref:cyclin-D1-1 isoform X1 n=1 Tax=Hevea brasiliensis TaxID=3981 RepID=UPI000B77FF13|nr:cyclin-D1-1 isoform X1 [Hevea brasiliensis]
MRNHRRRSCHCRAPIASPTFSAARNHQKFSPASRRNARRTSNLRHVSKNPLPVSLKMKGTSFLDSITYLGSNLALSMHRLAKNPLHGFSRFISRWIRGYFSWIGSACIYVHAFIHPLRGSFFQVQAYYRFQPLTAYLSVNYLDRFLYSRPLPQANGWPMHLLSVACLSVAAKMEEALVPSLLDLQFEGAKYIFEPRTIRRMELLVLSVLDWRLRSITPFSFLGFFACKIDSTGTYIGFLISRATEIILSNMKEASFLEYWPSSIAAAAILCAANEIPNLSLFNPEHAESWCDGLSKENIISCYRLMQDLVLDNSRRKPPKVLPLLRVTIRARMRSSDSSSSPSSSSSSSSSHKRRKLNNCLWTDDDKGNSE